MDTENHDQAANPANSPRRLTQAVLNALEHRRSGDTPANAVEDATWFLAELLVYSEGCRLPSSDVREYGEADGYSWRTLERAAAVLGIEKGKSGNTWFWLGSVDIRRARSTPRR